MQHESEKLTPRAREMFKLVEQYKSSSLSGKEFCKANNIRHTTFYWWLQQYRKKRGPINKKDKSAFLPVHIAPTVPINDEPPLRCKIEMSNGTNVNFYGSLRSDLILSIIQQGDI